MSIKRHLTPLIHRSRGSFDREVLLKLVEKMSEEEATALYRLLQSKESEVSALKARVRRGY